MTQFKEFGKGILKENPALVLVLGTCPALAVTTTAMNGLAMGAATAFVLLCSNLLVSLLKNLIPDKVRIPAFIIIIATFVTITDLLMQAYATELHKALGVFIPLIVVNCIILGRAEAFAKNHGVFVSVLDALGMGIGFTMALLIMGCVREVIGSGSIFGHSFVTDGSRTLLLFILPPGAFIVYGYLIALFNKVRLKASDNR